MKYIRQMLFLFALFFVFTISMAYAQEREDSTSYGLNSLWEVVDGDIKIGDHVYDKDELIKDFLSVAFSDYQWGEEEEIYKKQALRQKNEKSAKDEIKRQRDIYSGLVDNQEFYYMYPTATRDKYSIDYFAGGARNVYKEIYKNNLSWMYEYVYREKGVPPVDVINKWKKPVNVTLGFSSSVPDPWDYKFTFPSPEYQDDLEEHTVNTVNTLAANTRIDISYVVNNNGDLARPANVYIAFIRGMYNPWNVFKMDRGLRYSGPPWSANFIHNEEEKYIGAVRFTPYERAQAEGYFLTSAKNEIEMAVCYIWENHPIEMQKALIDECIIRSLGLPNHSKVGKEGVLAHGDYVDKKFARLSVLDGLADTSERPSARVPDYHSTSMIQKEIQKKPLPDGYSAYDLFMLRLLYSDQIKPGQSYRSVGVLLEDLFLNPKEKSSKDSAGR